MPLAMTILPGKARPTAPAEVLHRTGRRERWNVDDFLSVGRLQHFACVGLCIEFAVRAYIVCFPYLMVQQSPRNTLRSSGSLVTDGDRSSSPVRPPRTPFAGLEVAVAAGFIAGLLLWNSLPPTWGRRRPAVASILLFSIAFWVQALALVPGTAWALRFLTGVGLGQLTFLWTLELVRVEMRAAVASWALMGWAVGGFMAVAAAIFIRDTTTELFTIIPTLPVVLSLLIYTILCPESPQVMVLHYSHEAATHAMQRIARINKTLADYSALPEPIFSRRRPYRVVAELWATPLLDLLTILSFAIMGALLCAVRQQLLASLHNWPAYYAALTSSACALAALMLVWGSSIMGRKPLLCLCLLGAAPCMLLQHFQPLVPEVLATLALCFVIAGFVTLILMTAEGFPATSRTLGLALGGLAAIAGAAGFWTGIKDPTAAVATSSALLGVHFILTLCRPETAALAPRLRASDIVGDVQRDDEETQYLLPHT